MPPANVNSKTPADITRMEVLIFLDIELQIFKAALGTTNFLPIIAILMRISRTSVHVRRQASGIRHQMKQATERYAMTRWFFLLVFFISAMAAHSQTDEWKQLFDGKDL